jgi:hypothetical protein
MFLCFYDNYIYRLYHYIYRFSPCVQLWQHTYTDLIIQSALSSPRKFDPYKRFSRRIELTDILTPQKDNIRDFQRLTRDRRVPDTLNEDLA